MSTTPFHSPPTSPIGRLASLRRHPFFRSSTSVDRQESFWSDFEEVPKTPKVERKGSIWSSIGGFESIRSISVCSKSDKKQSRKMGNQQSNPRVHSHELVVAPSTGPDPSVFRPILPAHSVSMENTPTDQTFSRIDYTPAPNKQLPQVPHSNTINKSKGIARKLSTSARGFGGRGVSPGRSDEPPHSAGIKAMRTLGGDVRSFEAMVISAETRLEQQGPLQTIRTAKAATFAAHRARRSSIPDGMFEQPKSSPEPTPCPTHEVIPTSAQQANPRPIHHRKTSSGSFKQSPHRNGSIRSARRAEREWRAKVAALAAGGVGSSRRSHVELRGPVPPRRTPRNASVLPPYTPANLHESRSASPTDDTVITPPSTTIETQSISKGTMAKTIRSNRSFETLGHHAHIPRLQVNINNSPLPPRNRLVSVPQSVSSFYFDPNSTSRVSTRPNSMAASTLLSPAVPTSTFEAPSPLPPHRTQLPPFASFQSSPVTSQIGLPSQQALPSPLRREHDWDSTKGHERRSSAQESGIKRDPIKFNSLPAQSGIRDVSLNRQTSGLPPDFIPIGNFQPEQTPRRASHQASIPAQSPTTPYSPTTAYILTAPIEHISTPGIDFYPRSSMQGFQTPITPSHPFAVMQDIPSPEPPTPPSKSPIPIPQTHRPQPSQSVWTKGSIDPFASTPPRQTHHYSQSQSVANQPKHHQARPSLAQNRSKSGTSSIPSVLQPRRITIAPKQQILGSGAVKERYDIEKERARRREMGVDLTPGMESGVRPPKSGLPMNDLQKWLQQTSIQA